VKFLPLSIPDVLCIETQVIRDERGSFNEIFKSEEFSAAGIQENFVQENLSLSHRGVLRGLHYQIGHPQGKLIRVLHGETFDVNVDLRRRSPTFGKWVGIHLSERKRNMLWVPPGFAHGFYALTEPVELMYAVTDVFDPQGERTLLWNDPDLCIRWPIPGGINPILSHKDLHGKLLAEAETYDDL